jgi:hypothetical protein
MDLYKPNISVEFQGDCLKVTELRHGEMGRNTPDSGYAGKCTEMEN